jgi:hypothetical protein
VSTLPGSWSATFATALLATLPVVGLAAACGSSTQENQESSTQPTTISSVEQFDEFFDANYAGLTVKNLQDNNFEPEGDCVTKDSVQLADQQQQSNLKNMKGDMGVHWQPKGEANTGQIKSEREIRNNISASVEPITGSTDPNSSVVGIEESVEAKDWDEQYPKETPTDFGQEFVLYKSMGEMDMQYMGNTGEDKGEYSLHGYRDNNANGTFAFVGSNIHCSESSSEYSEYTG